MTISDPRNHQVDSPALKDAFAQMMGESVKYAERRIADIDAALEAHAKSRSLVSHAWVVVTPHDYWCVAYEFEPAGKGMRRAVSCEVRPAPIEKAPRYTEEDAKSLADDTFNGKGENMLAMHWVDALKREREHKIALIKEISSIPAPN